jgi:drug/metabolite transporter (DMT)-like permease
MTLSVSTPRADSSFASADFGLFAGTVLVWGTTWIAVKYQLGFVDPQVSLLWRFLIAMPVMFVICRIAGTPLRFPLAMHLRFAAFGLFGCAVNFLLFYNAAAFVVSGLLSVIFSLASLTNIAMAFLFLGDPLKPRVAVGALVGLLGVGLMFWHEIDTSALGLGALTGLALGVLGCISFSAANMISARLYREGVPAMTMNAWGLFYGVLFNFLATLFMGSAFTVEPTVRYMVSLLWLALPGTVIAFWMYLSLLGRIGPDRAGYTTILSPVLALVVSTIAEDYRWSAVAVAGLFLVAAGNVLILRRRAR